MGIQWESVDVSRIAQPGLGEMRIRGGNIKLGPGGPALLLDSDYAAVGITSVAKDATNGDLLVTLDYLVGDTEPNEQRLTMLASMNATAISKKVIVGISGGGGLLRVRFVRTDTGATVPCDSSYFGTSDTVCVQTTSIQISGTSPE